VATGELGAEEVQLDRDRAQQAHQLSTRIVIVRHSSSLLTVLTAQ
jgi:hypothetical protein